MNRLEMAKKLFENPKLKAISNHDDVVEVKQSFNMKYICFDNSSLVLELSHLPDESWGLLKPKLKEFTFEEAISYYFKHRFNILGERQIYASDIRSVVTANAVNNNISMIDDTEYNGKWTIEGVYDDE